MATAPIFLHFRLQNIILRFFFPGDIQKLYGVFTPLSFLNCPIGKQIIDQVFGNTKWATKKTTPTFKYTVILLVDRDPYVHFFTILKYNWVVFHPLYTVNNQGPFFHCSSTLGSFHVRSRQCDANPLLLHLVTSG